MKRTLLLSLAGAALLAAACAKPACTTVGERPVDFQKLNAQAAREYLIPVRPGVPGGQPFWNAYSIKFTYAPAFDFPEADGASSYRFDLWKIDDVWGTVWYTDPEQRPRPQAQKDKYSAGGAPVRSFTASSPKADLSPVWADLPVANYALVVTATGPDGKDLEPVGSREFLRDFPFEGPYPEACRGYRDAAMMALRFNHRQPLVRKIQSLQEGEKFETSNIFASKFLGAIIRSELLMAKYLPTYREECLRNARKTADILISIAQPEGTPLAHITPTYYDSYVQDKNAVNNGEVNGMNVTDLQAQTMALDPLNALNGYLDLFDATGEAKYYDEAYAMMKTYDRLVDETGFLPKKLYIATGKGVSDAGALTGFLLLVIQRFHNQYGVTDFDPLARRCESWMNRNLLDRFEMSAQFEDVSVFQKPYQNLSNIMPNQYARYLLQKERVTNEEMILAKDMIRFVEDQFVHWALPRDKDGLFYCLVPGTFEQYACSITIDASNAHTANTLMALYKKTGDPLLYEKARAQLNTIVNSQAVNGEIATFMGLDYGGAGGGFWINCSTFSALSLLAFIGDEALELTGM